MREGQYWVVKLDTSTYKKGATHIVHSGAKAFVDFGKEVTIKELRERMTGTLYYEWGHMEVKVNEAFEESKEYYDKLVSEYQWFMPNWLERIETNKKIVTEQGIYYYTKNKDNV